MNPAVISGADVFDVVDVLPPVADIIETVADAVIADGYRLEAPVNSRLYVIFHGALAVRMGRMRVKVSRDLKHQKHLCAVLREPVERR